MNKKHSQKITQQLLTNKPELQNTIQKDLCHYVATKYPMLSITVSIAINGKSYD